MVTNSVLPSVVKKFRLPEILNASEQSALLSIPNKNAPTGLRNFCMLSLFLNLGLRVNELILLKVKDIDWLSGKLTVREGKGGRDRILWLSENDLEQLHQWRLIRPPGGSYLFCTLAGGRLNDRYVRDMVKRYARRAGIEKDIHPHTLRHTFATDLLRDTKNIRLVQRALGHVSIANTMIYTHIVDDELESSLKSFRNNRLPSRKEG
ncbi:MAG: tyrosine-type recombinase/integrase [Candidatus Margulisbacteria bacterium]|nr:tyrosine-type recombinase/integrase [Candidatus Margulisiibacteriota bacterium]